ncbi:MAG: hypothetical protein QF475_00550 [Candidatus Undinarchaeales archaeon]|jgi:hypothetical protein|nr:hypothetical protein [Candidatus Undinarchaeales archaeon]
MKKILITMLLFAILLAVPVAASENTELLIEGGVVEKSAQQGDTINLHFTVKSIGKISASNLYYELIADASVTGYSTGRVSMGGVGVGETKSIKVPLIIASDATDGAKSITIKIWYSGGTQSPLQKTFSFNVGSDVSMHLDNILYSKDHIEPGKNIQLTAVITNVGDNPASSLFAEIAATSEYIKPVLSGGTDYVSQVPVGGLAQFYFTINVDSDAETETYDATITLTYDDDSGNQNIETFNIGIPVSGTPKLEVLNTEIDGSDFKVEMENLGTAKAKAIRVELVQGGKIMGVKIDNELKPDKHSTLRFKTFRRGSAQLVIHYLDDENMDYDETIDIEVPGSSGKTSKWSVIFFIIVVIESIYIYRRKKGKTPLNIPFLKKKR